MRRGSLVAAACVALAIVRAYVFRWTCDDAFLSFRYAANLIAGRGLVFNAGERVEGYTNFGWTLGIASGLGLGIDPETWTRVVGGAAFAGTVAILAFVHHRLARPRLVVPFAALAYACMPDAAINAVSGLETGLFTMFVTAGYAALVTGAITIRRSAIAGLFFALATLTRPDGVVFAGAAVLWLAGRRSRAPALASALVIGAIVGAHVGWRYAYYGDLLPNTYYAKSGGAAWWSQGLVYARLYLERYPVLATAPFVALAVVRYRRALAGPAILAIALGAAHVLWVVRVGGDFMFARFLVPATPLLLVALDLGLVAIARPFPRITGAFALALAFVFAFMPSPLRGATPDHGIVDEHAFYTAVTTDGITGPQRSDHRAALVRPVLAGTGARVAFYGAESRFVYYADIPFAVECSGGLTSPEVAREPLLKRGRVGHEKRATAPFLVDRYHADLAFSPSARSISGLDAWVPFVPVDVKGVAAQLLHWDPRFVAALRARGVVVPDFPAMLDAIAPHLDELPPNELQHAYDLARHFYFAFVDDRPREERYTSRLQHGR